LTTTLLLLILKNVITAAVALKHANGILSGMQVKYWYNYREDIIIFEYDINGSDIILSFLFRRSMMEVWREKTVSRILIPKGAGVW